MAGAWEFRAQRQVLAYVLHVETTSVAWAFGLKNLIVPGQWMPISGMPFDHARNHAAQVCLEQGFEWLFSLDSDVIPPHDAVLRLLNHKLPIVSGLYARRSPPHGHPVAMKDGHWIAPGFDYKPGALVEVDVVGAGCLLIHRSVIEQFSKNRDPKRPEKLMFSWQVDARGFGIWDDRECMSEDFVMNVRAKKHMGIKTWLDTSILCKHVGHFECTPGNAQPLNTTPVT